MTSTFLVELDHGDDTDLVGISEEIQDALLSTLPFEVRSVKPWTHPTLQTPGMQQPPQAPPLL